MDWMKTIFGRIVIFIIIIFIIIFLHSIGILRPIEGVITAVLKPVQVPLYYANLSITDRSLLSEKQDLINENQSLSNRINELIAENAELNNLLGESVILEDQINFLTEHEFNYQPAKIINKFTVDNAQLVTINQGSNKGLEPGMAVIADKKIIIGKLYTVAENTAQIMLITSNLSEVGAQVENEVYSPGLVTGRHGLSLNMELIPKNDEIKERQLVISSGVEEKIPKGLVIGEIEAIESNAGDLFNSATLVPLIDYSRLSIVSVIIP